MLDIKRVNHLGTPAVPTNGNGPAVELKAQGGKGYEIIDGSTPLNAGTKSLQVSVCGTDWDDLVAAISGNAQGAIADQYHFARLVIGTYVAGTVTVKVVDPRQE